MAFELDVTGSSGQLDGIQFMREDLRKRLSQYNLIKDCLEGSETVKRKGDIYLPRPDARNKSDDNLSRYQFYLNRAVFYNVSQRTALGLLGQIFMRPPVVKTPKQLENVVTDSNGGGISLEQLARDACWQALSLGRLGLFVDYPPTSGPTSKAEQTAGNIRPSINVIDPDAIINWRTIQRGSKVILSLIVFKEEYTTDDDGFKTETAIGYRELRLDDSGQYFVQLWRSPDNEGSNYEKYQAAYYPKDGKGMPLTEIPFTFVGSRNNEPTIDPAPLYDMCTLNIAHYCNSADYEELVYIAGQPMLVISGLSSEWYKEVLKSKIPFGTDRGLALPVGATAELIQAEERPGAFVAMEHKERQMVALGARLVQESKVQRTAKEAGMENASEQSTLVAIAKNVSKAFEWALEWCAVLSNIPETQVEFQLNTDFELAQLDDIALAAVVKSWVDGAISFTEMRSTMRKAGRTSLTDEQAKAEIEKDQQAAIEKAAKEIGMTTKAVTENGPPIDAAA